MTLAIAVAAIGLTFVPASAQAVVVQWGTSGGTAPNYRATVNGDYLLLGNGVLACSGATVLTSNQAAAGTCDELHAATSASTGNANDNFQMVNSNSVAGFSTNSSSATVTIPSGATVVKAFLNWSANTGTFLSGTTVTTACVNASGRSPSAATLPAGSATGYQTQGVQLKVGGNAIMAVPIGSVLEDFASQTSTRNYSAGAEVTTAFAGAVTGSALTVSAGNIWAPNGAGCFAGWSLTLVYDYGTYVLGQPASVPHQVIYYEGHVREASTDSPLTVNFNGFTAVSAGTRIGVSLFEGDRIVVGDTASYSRQGSATFTEIPNSAGVMGNFGIGRADGSVRYTGAGTTTFTNQSVDAFSQPLANVVTGDTSVALKIGTSGDSYLLRNAVLSVPVAALQVDKTYNGTADTQWRTSTETATFTITITNTGAGDLQNITIADDQTNCSRSLTGIVLAPLQSTTFTCTANGPANASYVSTATATATTVSGGYLATGKDSTNVALSAITLAKSGALAPGATGRAGDVITFTFVMKNTGAGSLTGVTVTDPLVGLSAITFGAWPSGTAGTLAAGQTVTATATYVLTQADVDAGSVSNTAATVGTDQDGGVKPTAMATATTPIASAGALAVTKTGAYAPGTSGRVGERINYSFTIRNTGNVTLTNTTLTDPLPGLSPPIITWPTATAGRLAPGETATATASYTITQANVDAGVVNNTATASAKPPTGANVSASSPQSTVPTTASAPSITTTKSGVAFGAAAVGSVITYSFTAKNTGNVTLTGVAITDPLVGLSAISYGAWPSGTAGTLAPGETVSATATYTITQADVDAGSVKNTATSTGKPPSGANVTGASPQSTVATAAAAPSVALTKSGLLAPGATAGSTVAYSFSLKNSGNVTLTGVTISDPLAGLSALTYTWPGTAGTLTPGQTVTAKATYVIKQSDVDAGSVANTATGSGKPLTGANVTQNQSATVPITQIGSLVVTKAGVLAGGTGVAGDTINYSFSVRNSGNVSLTQVAISDPLSGLSSLVYSWPGTAGALAPGQTATATATYVIKQSDVDAGSVKNTATGTGKPPTGASVAASSAQVTVPTAAAAPSIATTKSSSRTGTGVVGDVITYTFTSKNTGNVTLTGVAISDPLVGLSAINYGAWPSGTAGTLAPGQTVTATATYTIKQSDVDAGSVKNTASSTGKPPTGATVTASSALVTTGTAVSAPSVALTKSGLLAPGATAGSTVAYSFSLKNSGNVTLTGVTISDPLVGLSALTYTWPGTAGALTPGQTVTAKATYVLKQSDVDAGSVANTATGSGTPPTGANVTQSQSATVPVSSAPALLVTKAGLINAPGTGTVGNVITYSVSARNTGNVTLTGVTIADTLPGLSALSYAWPGTAGTLTPGQTVSATATYTITQADVDAGSVKNTATATGKPPTGANVTASSPQSTVATVVPAPAILTSKSAARAGTGAVGDVITYSFTSKNTGNVTLTGVAISDPLVGLSAINYGAWPSGTAGTLSPGETVSATATYTITQADVDAGSVKNTATGSGTPPSGAPVTSLPPQVTTSTAASAPATVLTKTGALAGSPVAGSTVTYSFTLRNSGNVTLTAAGISDPLPGLSALSYSWPGPVGRLLPGQTATATATYVVTQADVDAGSIANTSSSTAKPPTGANVASTAPATVALASAASVGVTKTGTITAPGTGLAGDTIAYSFTVSNTGNVTLTGVIITDSKPGVTIPVVSWPGTAGTLVPGQSATGTATYTITQADVDAGSVRNTATTSGKPPTGATVQATSTPSVVATATATPSITTTKAGVIASGETGVAGDSVQYSFQSTNSGNVTLTGVTISDPKPGLSAIVYRTWPSGTVGTLAPGQSITATASYLLTQADVDAGSVSNTASSSGTPPTGAPVSDASPTTIVQTAASAPSTVFSKTGTLAAGSTGSAGDTVNYSFGLRNSGNVTLTGVSIADPLPGISALAYIWPGTAGTLLPDQTVTATATFLLTQADVDAGAVSNTASSTATPPTGAAVTRTSSATVPIVGGPAIEVTKTGAITAPGTGLAGDSIAYSFIIRNAGNVTLAGVTLRDSKLGVSTPVIIWPGATGRLAPGQTATATATYTVTQADVDAGSVTNTATTSGTPPTGAPVSALSAPSVVVLAAPAPAITTTKSGTTSGSGAVGDTITWALSARNSGDVTLTGVSIADTLPGLSALSYSWPSAVGTLAPGQTVSASGTYLITQADVDAGSVANAATTVGTPPSGPAVSGASPRAVVATTDAAPSVLVQKSGALAGGSTGRTGDVVNYSFSITNSGNVTLRGVALADPLPGLSALAYTWSATPGTLAPGQRATAAATYTLTQADVDAGSVANTVTGSGTPPSGGAATGTAPATVPVPRVPALEVTKSGAIAAPGTGLAGDRVVYTFAITNTGNVTVSAITLADSKPGVSAPVITWPGATGTLGPAQVASATASYTLTQADVDAGLVRNTATTSGRAPGGVTVTDASPESVVTTEAARAAITTAKSGAIVAPGTGAVGDVIRYSFAATNTGNVSLTGVTITDPLPGLSTISYGAWPSGTAGTLRPGQAVTATATHSITQADVDAGSITNLASSSGTAPNSVVASSSSSPVVVNTTPSTPRIGLTKSAALAAGATGVAGDRVIYSFTIRNTGNVTLSSVAIADPLPGISVINYVWPATAGTLAPGQAATGTASYVLTRADVDAGSVANNATATATPPTGAAVSDSASATVNIAARPELTVSKSGAIRPAGTGLLGETIDYSFTVENTGNVTLSSVTLSDPLPGLSTPVVIWPGRSGTLAPGQRATATAHYVITQADVDAGIVNNTATAQGTSPSGATVSDASPRETVVLASARAALTTTKSGVIVAPGAGRVGETIRFTISARNVGSLTLTNVAITDTLAGLGSLAYGPWPGGTVGTLAPGETVTATANYTITQADVDAGEVRNTATTSATDPNGGSVNDDSLEVSVSTATQIATIAVTHAGSLPAGTPSAAGDLVDWSYSLTNTGNVTLRGVSLLDALPGLIGFTYTWPGTPGTLLPGQTVRAAATYALTQSDINSGAVSSTVAGSGTPPRGADATGSAPATVPLQAAGSIDVIKQAALSPGGTGVAGDTIDYRFRVTNTGNVSLAAVTLMDSLAGLSTPVVTWPAATGRLEPGQSASATATYTITQADVDAGSVFNQATASATTPAGATVADLSLRTEVRTATPTPAIATTKSGAVSGAGAVGDVVTWSFTIRNSGNVTLAGVVLADSLPGLSTPSITWPRATGTLAPGEVATATASYVITQADVDAGSITNTATSTGTAPDTSTVSGASAPATVTTAAAAPNAVFSKTGALSAGDLPVAGSTVGYAFSYRNTGTVTLAGVAIADPLPGLSTLAYSWPGTPGTLAPGQLVSATATHLVTQADVDAGSIANSSTATATPVRGAPFTRISSATVPLTAGPAIETTKVGTLASGEIGIAGDTIDYAFTIKNSGNVTLTGVALTDSRPGVSTPVVSWPGTPATLLPGATATATATYTITQADVDAGAVRNTASVSGTPPSGPVVRADSAESVVATAAPVTTLATTKTAVLAGPGNVGNTVTYTFSAKNTGNVTLTGVTIADPLPRLSALSYAWPATVGTLLPGQTVTATATYVLTQADLDAGKVVNTATASATSPTGGAVSDASPESVVPTAPAVTTLAVTHGGALAAGATGVAGDRIDWTYSLTNTGNVTLTGVTLADLQPGQFGFIYSWPGTPGTLLPGQTMTAVSKYLLTQDDIDAGSVTTNVTGSGTPPTGSSVTATAPATVAVAARPTLAVSKTGAVRAPGTGVAGNTIDYSFVISNTGNVTLTLVDLIDSLGGVSNPVINWPGTPGILAPGQTAPATATYTITQTDVDSGSIVNTATATGKPPTGAIVSASSPPSTIAAATPASLIATAKSASVSGPGAVGDTITYTLTAQNNGNVTLSGVEITDLLPGLSPITYGPWPSGTVGVLAPGQTVTATSTYVITQADVDRGSVVNTATSRGTSPQGLVVTDDSPMVTTPTVAAAPALTTTKTAVLAAGSTGVAGDRIDFVVAARNAGNVTLTGVSLSDPLPGISALAYTWPGTPGTLAPGQSVTATATYTVTQADVDAGSVANAVTAVGTPPTGPALTSTAPAIVPIAPYASLHIIGTGTLESGGIGRVGDVILFSSYITYAGNVTLTTVWPSASLAGLFDLSLTWPGTPGTLLPGQSLPVSGRYTITQADVDRGYVENLTGVTGRTPVGVLVAATPDLVRVNTVSAVPAISTTKSGTASGARGVGDTVTYTIVTTNTGDVTLTGVTVADPKPGLSTISYGAWPSATPGTLAPGTSVTSTATYLLTQADVDAGSTVNVASSSGTSPSGAAVSGASAPAIVNTATSAPAVSVTDSGVRAGGTTAIAGDIVTFTYTLANTGNVTLRSVDFTDALAGIGAPTYSWPATAGTLAPGQSVTATASYPLSQADVDRGSVASTVTGSGTPPTGGVVVKTATATVSYTAAPAIGITQSAALNGVGAVGDTITFTYRLTNTGNQSLTTADLTESNALLPNATITWPAKVGSLAPGQSATATATYTITQAEVDAGLVRNTETTTGRSPSGDLVTAASTEAVIPLAASAPALTTTKTGTLAAGHTGAVGDVISYAITIVNSGNVTLTGVTLADPLRGLSTPAITWPAAPATLAPGQRAIATATYAITQADVDRGSVRNTATSGGTPPSGAAVSAPSAESVVATETAAPRIAVSNAGTLAAGSTGIAGDTVTFSYTVTNTGTVTLATVALADSLPGVGAPAYVWTGTAGTLAPGETATATATYLLTQADVNAGSVTSIVTGSGTSPAGTVVSASAPATVPITPAPGLAVTQQASIEAPGIGQVGDVIFISVVVTNTGNVTITNGRLVAPLPGLFDIVINWPGPVGTLLAGQSLTGSARYTIRQEDVDAGFVTNVVDIAGKAPSGATVTAASNSITIPTVRPAPRLTTTKTGAFAAQGRVGDTITYTITALNAGNVTLGGVTISDPLAGLSAVSYGPWPTGTVGTLAPGKSVTGTATYVITQNDVDNGAVVNTASSAGTAPDGTPVSDSSDPVSTATVTPTAPSLAVTNAAALAPGSTGVAGDTVVLSYTVRNTGDVTLFGSILVDPAGGIGPITYTWPGAVGTVAPGQTVTASATYVLTQADIDAGSYVSVINGSGTPRVGAAALDSAVSTVVLSASPALSIVKSGAPAVAGQTGLGDRVDYAFSATNNGNVTLTSVALHDALPGISGFTYTWPSTPGTLAPGQTVTATASYALRQADVDRGRVDNSASVSGVTPGGRNVVASSALVSVTTEAAAPALTTTKSGVISAGAGNAGSTVTYTFRVTNSGNVTLRVVSVTDALAGVSLPVVTFPATSGILAPGETAVGTATYRVTQADVDSGGVLNIATGKGTAPDGTVVSDPSDPSSVSTAPAAPAVRTTQTAALAAGNTGVVGDTIDYRFSVANSGNVTLTGVTLANSVASLGPVTYTWPGTPGTLAPGQTVTVVAARAVTQADVDAGAVRNTATGRGIAPSGAVVSNPSAQTVVTLLAAAPALAVTKSGVASGTGARGDTITWSLSARNSGNVTLTGVAFSDSLAGLSALGYGTWASGTAGTLAPGDTITATATSVITQADVDTGSVRNTATAAAAAPSGDPVSARSADAVVTTAGATPSLTLAKQQVFGPGATGRAGDIVSYTFQVTDSGNQTLTGVSVADAQAGIGALAYTWPGTPGTLLPGQTATATASYVLTQADVDAGSIASAAPASGTTPSAASVSASATGRLTVAAAPALGFTKTGSFETVAQQGARILYDFRIVNTGNVTITGAAISDALPGLSAITYSWPGAVGVLLPGQAVTATASYRITQADVDAGTVVNTATVAGLAPGAIAVSATDGDTRAVPNRADIQVRARVELRAGQAGYPGDVLDYTYVVVNTGTTTLTGVRVSDSRTGLSPIVYGAWPGTPGVLLPGQSVVASAFYVIRPVDAGTRLSTIARVISTNSPDGSGVLDDDVVEIQLSTLPLVPGIPAISGPGGLALTGSEVAPWLGAGLLLLLSGVVLMFTAGTTRRKDRES